MTTEICEETGREVPTCECGPHLQCPEHLLNCLLGDDPMEAEIELARDDTLGLEEQLRQVALSAREAGLHAMVVIWTAPPEHPRAGLNLTLSVRADGSIMSVATGREFASPAEFCDQLVSDEEDDRA